MSVTTLIEEPDVKEWLRTHFHKPDAPRPTNLRVAPRAGRESIIGTAFDYLLQAHLHRRFPAAVADEWVATGVLKRARSATEREALERFLRQAREIYRTFIAGAANEQQMALVALRLVPFDLWARLGDRRGLTVRPTPEEVAADVDELQALMNVVPFDELTPRQLCILNPSFGASGVVGGADGDILIDDILIDIKCSKEPKLLRDWFNQLVAYYLVHRVGGIVGAPPDTTVRRLAIYSARHGLLRTFRVADIVQEEKLPELLEWFVARGQRHVQASRGGE